MGTRSPLVASLSPRFESGRGRWHTCLPGPASAATLAGPFVAGSVRLAEIKVDVMASWNIDLRYVVLQTGPHSPTAVILPVEGLLEQTCRMM
jgi:hypothetical protein